MSVPEGKYYPYHLAALLTWVQIFAYILSLLPGLALSKEHTEQVLSCLSRESLTYFDSASLSLIRLFHRALSTRGLAQKECFAKLNFMSGTKNHVFLQRASICAKQWLYELVYMELPFTSFQGY